MGTLLRSATTLKLIKYSTASAVAVVFGQATLIFGLEVLVWPALAANLLSVSVGAVPNYLINRYWTWQQTGKNRLWGEIIPFWSMAILGVFLSMIAVAIADSQTEGNTLAIAIANLSGFGVLWIGRFLILDRIMWKVVHDLHPEIDLDAEDVGLAAVLHLEPEPEPEPTGTEPAEPATLAPAGPHSNGHAPGANGAVDSRRANGAHDSSGQGLDPAPLRAAPRPRDQ